MKWDKNINFILFYFILSLSINPNTKFDTDKKQIFDIWSFKTLHMIFQNLRHLIIYMITNWELSPRLYSCWSLLCRSLSKYLRSCNCNHTTTIDITVTTVEPPVSFHYHLIGKWFVILPFFCSTFSYFTMSLFCQWVFATTLEVISSYILCDCNVYVCVCVC